MAENNQKKDRYNVTDLVSEQLQNNDVLSKSGYARGGYTKARQFTNVYLKEFLNDIDEVKERAESGHQTIAYYVDDEKTFNDIKTALSHIDWRDVEDRSYSKAPTTKKKAKRSAPAMRKRQKQVKSDELTIEMDQEIIKTLKALATYKNMDVGMLIQQIVAERIIGFKDALDEFDITPSIEEIERK